MKKPVEPGLAGDGEQRLVPVTLPGAAADDQAPPRRMTKARTEHFDEIRDELPADLNVSEFVGVYQFPGNERRRIPALLYGISGLLMVGAWLARRGDRPIQVNTGVGICGLLFLGLAVYSWFAGARLNVQDIDALVAASKAVGFPVGHASAQLGWRGLISRPTWRILLYSAEEPPASRGLVLVDGVDGTVIDQMVQPNPEDWSALNDTKLTAS